MKAFRPLSPVPLIDWGLRDYGIEPSIWGGDKNCEHEWTDRKYYTEKSAGKTTKEAFSEAGEENIQRLKEARWRQDSVCDICGAWFGQLGLEPDPFLYVRNLVEIFRMVRRVLRKDGTIWIVIGDSYATGAGKVGNHPGGGRQGDNWKGQMSSPNRMPIAGLKPKDLCGIPWRLALALQADGWYLRSDIIWSKPNCMPESVKDRPTRAHEYVFLLTKAEKYFYDGEAIKEPITDYGQRGTDSQYQQVPGGGRNDGLGNLARKIRNARIIGEKMSRNKRTVWTINPEPFPDVHYAVFPKKLVQICLEAGTSEKGCCPKCGAPWERIIEKQSFEPKDYKGKWLKTDKQSSGRRLLAHVRAAREAGGDHDNPFPAAKTAGWQSTCKCNETETEPCIVLDPFSGSGTVGQVAKKLNRKAILIDPKEEYCEMALKRIRQEVFDFR